MLLSYDNFTTTVQTLRPSDLFYGHPFANNYFRWIFIPLLELIGLSPTIGIPFKYCIYAVLSLVFVLTTYIMYLRVLYVAKSISIESSILRFYSKVQFNS